MKPYRFLVLLAALGAAFVPAAFAADPSGRWIAITSVAVATGPVITASFGRRTIATETTAIVDLDQGSVTVISDEPSVGFWWSPQGDSIIFLTVDDRGNDRPRLRWHPRWRIATGAWALTSWLRFAIRRALTLPWIFGIPMAAVQVLAAMPRAASLIW